MPINTPFDPPLPAIAVTEDEQVYAWRQGLLETFRHLYNSVYLDILELQVPIGHYALTNSDSEPFDYGTWNLDKTDGDGVRFWRRTA